MSNRLRVGNLGFNIELTQLKEIFGEFGTVMNAQIMASPLSGKSRGFGFVEMKSAEEAANSIAGLSDRDFNGQKFMITEAPEEKKSRARRAR